MKFTIAASAMLLAVGVSAQAVLGPNGNCLFPNGPTCVGTGKRNARGQREFQEPANSPGDNCCLFPGSCGNGDGVAVFGCVKVGGRAAAGKGNGKKKNAKANGKKANAKRNAKANGKKTTRRAAEFTA